MKTGWKFSFKIVIWGLAFVIGMMIFTQIRAKAQGEAENAAKDKWYAEQERALLEDVRQYLSCKGFENSGVTLTRVLYGDGERSYTFKIHHRRIDLMSEQEREALSEELLKLTSGYKKATITDTCEFRCEFLILHDIFSK